MTAPYQPVAVVPSAPGQLSNKRGSNTGADAIAMQFKYQNQRGSGDQIGSINVSVVRTILQGSPTQSNTAWASSWVGVPATSPLPTNVAAGANSVATYGGRVYALLPTTGPFTGAGWCVLSAPLSGANVGTWRYELPGPLSNINDFAVSGAPMVQINGRLYVWSQFTIWQSVIQSDGTLGAWTAWLTTTSGAGTTMGAYQNSDGSGVIVLFYNLNPTIVSGIPVNIDGTHGTTTGGAGWAPGTQRGYGAVHIDGKTGHVFYIGGEDGAGTPQSTVYWATLNTTTAALGAFAAGQALPAVRSRAAYVYQPIGTAFVDGATAWICGGIAVAAGADQTTVYSNGSGNIRGATAWTTSTGTLATATSGAGGCVTASHFDVTNANNPYLCVVAGKNTAVVQVASAGLGNFNCLNFRSGASPELTAALLGTGGAVTNNQDGSVTIGFNYGAFGVAINNSFLDGDQFQVTIQFTDLTGGDPSAALTTGIRVGQPPTVTTLAVTAGGQPTATWVVTPGAGAGPQANWRATLDASLFDSDTRLGTANNVVLSNAPMLPNAVQRTLTVTANSTDVPMAGSSNVGTATFNFTPANVGPTVPTGITATPAPATGSIAVAWTNPGGSAATFNRVYYRRNGTVAWNLYQDNVVAVIGAQQSINALDELALGVAYDFTVSACTATTESAQGVAALNAKIDPAPSGYTSMLHIQGSGMTYQALLKAQQTPKNVTHVDSQVTEMWGLQMALVRYGVFHYRTVEVQSFEADTATMKMLQALLNQALTGQPFYYRDAFGAMLLCAFDKEQPVEYKATYRYATLRLVEVNNQYAPSTAQGSAAGFRKQSNGSLVPLDPSEAIL